MVWIRLWSILRTLFAIRTSSVRIMNAPATGPLSSDANKDIVHGLVKGLAILACFNADRPMLSLTDAAKLVGITRASARRALHTLCSVGYVRFDGKHFHLQPKVLELGFQYLSSLKLPELVQPSLDAISESIQESSSAAIFDGSDIVLVARTTKRKFTMYDIGVGSRLPAHCTALGRVLLASDTARLRHLLDHLELQRFTPYTETDPGRLEGIIEQVRNDGYALVDQELELGLRSIAVPFSDTEGRCICAVNVALATARMRMEEVVEQVLPVLLDAQKRANYLIQSDQWTSSDFVPAQQGTQPI